MATTVGTTPTARVDRPARTKAWAGIAFAVLYVVGTMMAALSPDDADKLKDDPAGLAALWHDFYSDSGHRITIVVGAFILAAAALAMVVFGTALRDRLAESGDAPGGRLALAGAILFAGVTLVGAAALAWIPGSKEFGDVALPTGDLAYLGSQLGFAVMLLGGGATAALFLVSGGFSSARRGVLPSWLGWAGVVIGVVLFFVAAWFLPMVLLVLWVLIAAIVMVRSPSTV